MSRIHWILPGDEPGAFPPDSQAFREPDGLIAAGGDLSPERLLAAYRRGIFPWYEEGQVILWWTPDPRTILWPDNMHRSRSLRRTLRRTRPRISVNTAFGTVIDACAAPRSAHTGTWITGEMNAAYRRLHELGHAHSVEVWIDKQLTGGIYGVAIGGVFFGESMFSHVTDASKIALIALAMWLKSWNFGLIDGQVKSAHLVSLGSTEVSRKEFVSLLAKHCPRTISPEVWSRRENLAFKWP